MDSAVFSTDEYFQRLTAISENFDFISKCDVLSHKNTDAFEYLNKEYKNYTDINKRSCGAKRSRNISKKRYSDISYKPYNKVSKVDLDDDDDVSVLNDKIGYHSSAFTSSGVSSTSLGYNKETSIHSRKTASYYSGSTSSSIFESSNAHFEQQCTLDNLINKYKEKLKSRKVDTKICFEDSSSSDSLDSMITK